MKEKDFLARLVLKTTLLQHIKFNSGHWTGTRQVWLNGTKQWQFMCLCMRDPVKAKYRSMNTPRAKPPYPPAPSLLMHMVNGCVRHAEHWLAFRRTHDLSVWGKSQRLNSIASFVPILHMYLQVSLKRKEKQFLQFLTKTMDWANYAFSYFERITCNKIEVLGSYFAFEVWLGKDEHNSAEPFLECWCWPIWE